MKKFLPKFLLTLLAATAIGITSIPSAEAYCHHCAYKYKHHRHCRWVPGHWSHGYWHRGHTVCWRRW